MVVVTFAYFIRTRTREGETAREIERKEESEKEEREQIGMER